MSIECELVLKRNKSDNHASQKKKRKPNKHRADRCHDGNIKSLYVVRSVVKTEGEVENDDECVENVFRFHAKLQA